MLNKEKLTQRNLFFTLLTEEIIQKILQTREKVLPLITNLNADKINRFLSEKAHTIKTLLYHPSMSNEQLHDLRKELKKFHYDVRSLQLNESEHLKIASDELMEYIGNWHDKEICVQHLNNALKKERFSEKEKKQLNTIINGFRREGTRLYQQIKHMMVQAVLQETGGGQSSEHDLVAKASA